jgi:hypothetical protein
VGPFDLQVIEQPDRVGRHVGEQVGGRGRATREGLHQLVHHLDALVDRDLGRQADIAVVEPDHVEAAVDEALAQLDVPRHQLGAEAHHEEERGILRIAEGLVLDLDAVARCAHAAIVDAT